MSKYAEKTLRECFHPKAGKPNLRRMDYRGCREFRPQNRRSDS